MIGENGLVGGIYSILTLVPSLAVSARRLQDIGKSGWFMLILFIPSIFMGVIAGIMAATSTNLGFVLIFGGLALFALAIYFILLYVAEGNKGPNKYGPDPKKREFSVEDHLID